MYFTSRVTAMRYRQGRPFFHPLIVQRIRDRLEPARSVSTALDVGCGTGQSAVALAAIAERVVGVDASPAMLTAALTHDRARYVAAAAERLPFAAEAFDLATVALAFHWLDREHFLFEAGRVLRPNGWLVIYDNGWRAEMRENPDFARWARGAYLARYPTQPRDRRAPTEGEMAAHGLRLVGEEIYANDVIFSVEGLAGYLATQSNVIAAVERGDESVDEAVAWIAAAARPLFPSPTGTFAFGGTIRYLKKGR